MAGLVFLERGVRKDILTLVSFFCSNLGYWRRKWQPTPVWKTPWTEEPSGLQSMGSQWVGHDWVTNTSISWDKGSGLEILSRIVTSLRWFLRRSAWHHLLLGLQWQEKQCSLVPSAGPGLQAQLNASLLSEHVSRGLASHSDGSEERADPRAIEMTMQMETEHWTWRCRGVKGQTRSKGGWPQSLEFSSLWDGALETLCDYLLETPPCPLLLLSVESVLGYEWLKHGTESWEGPGKWENVKSKRRLLCTENLDQSNKGWRAS